jgi:hypothetical protein
MLLARRRNVRVGLGGAPTGCGDLLLGRGGERVRAHLDSHRDVTGTEDLDRQPGANRTGTDQIVDADRAALGEELAELVQVHDLVLHPERVLEAAQLRDSHVQRHLATLETLGRVLARAGALGATAGGLATLATLTPTHTDLGALGARRRAQVMNLQRHVSRPPRRSPDGRPC